MTEVYMGLMTTCWLGAYTLIIVEGFRTGKVHIPSSCTFINITWEFYLGFYSPPPEKHIQLFAAFWCTLNILILYQVIEYNKSSFPTWMGGGGSIDLGSTILYVASICGILYLCLEVHKIFGTILGDPYLRYDGIFIQMYMSLTFVQEIEKSPIVSRTELYIGVLRGIGSFFAGFGNYPGPPMYTKYDVIPHTILITILDLIYVVKAWRKYRISGRLYAA